MENSLKQRIVGAVVLIALAVIFLPAILKEKTQKEPFQSQIPAKPVELLSQPLDSKTKQSLEQSRQKLTQLAQLSDKKTESEETGNFATQDSQNEAQASDTVKAEQEQKSNAAAETKVENSPRESGSAKSVVEAKPPVETIGPQFKDAAWVIQVASFSSKDNALRMVEKLKKARHKAYRREGKGQDGKIIYRIYVGPYIEKVRAQAALDKVNQVSETSGILIPFDPTRH